MKTGYGKKILMVILIGTVLNGLSLFAQTGDGGTESLFDIGSGARILGMGNTAVAFPDDPAGFFWNPAGMVVVEEKGLSVSLTTLFEDVQYQCLGYVHPTLNSGTFGLGVSYIGTDGIKIVDDIGGIPVERGDFGYWWGKLSLVYAITLWKGLSAGANFEVNRQVMDFYSTNGFGLNAGLHYGFTQAAGFLRHLHFGFTFENAISPRLKLGVSTETIPYKFRGGVAKKIFMREDSDHLVIAGDMEKGKYSDFRYHAGVEYCWNQMVFLRTGVNNGDLTFGGGLRYKQFQLDYASAPFGDVTYFPRSHRFSLIFHVGKSIPVQRALLEQERRDEIQRQFSERMEEERQRKITEGLKSGKEYLENGDYFNARLEFSRVLREDKNNEEALNLLNITTEREQARQRDREEELLRQVQDKEKRRRDNIFVNQRLTEGVEALQKGDFKGAVDKWKQALERDPNNPQIQTYIRQAEEALGNEVNKMIARANQLVRQENISEAYKVLGRAKEQSEGNEELNNQVLSQIYRLDQYVDFVTNYQEGVQRYSRGEYESAAQFFEKALAIQPNHAKAKEFYRNSIARSKDSKEEMTGEVRELFYRGINLYRDGNYQEALDVWERALELDPYNVKLLEAVAGARRKLETFQKTE